MSKPVRIAKKFKYPENHPMPEKPRNLQKYFWKIEVGKLDLIKEVEKFSLNEPFHADVVITVTEATKRKYKRLMKGQRRGNLVVIADLAVLGEFTYYWCLEGNYMLKKNPKKAWAILLAFMKYEYQPVYGLRDNKLIFCAYFDKLPEEFGELKLGMDEKNTVVTNNDEVIAIVRNADDVWKHIKVAKQFKLAIIHRRKHHIDVALQLFQEVKPELIKGEKPAVRHSY